jgi:hypothetical protein
MSTPATTRTLRLLLDEQSTRSLISILADLAAFFDNCQGQTADDVSDHFDDLAAVDWIPIVLAEHAQLLTAAITACAFGGDCIDTGT